MLQVRKGSCGRTSNRPSLQPHTHFTQQTRVSTSNLKALQEGKECSHCAFRKKLLHSCKPSRQLKGQLQQLRRHFYENQSKPAYCFIINSSREVLLVDKDDYISCHPPSCFISRGGPLNPLQFQLFKVESGFFIGKLQPGMSTFEYVMHFWF